MRSGARWPASRECPCSAGVSVGVPAGFHASTTSHESGSTPKAGSARKVTDHVLDLGGAELGILKRGVQRSETGVHRVHVTVVNAGHHRAAIGVDDLGFVTGVLRDLTVAADGEDSSVGTDGHGAGHGVGVVAHEHPRVADDRGGLGARRGCRLGECGHGGHGSSCTCGAGSGEKLSSVQGGHRVSCGWAGMRAVTPSSSSSTANEKASSSLMYGCAALMCGYSPAGSRR